MSEGIKVVVCALWIAHPILQTAIAVVMLRRGQHRLFKYFFAYIVIQIPIFALCFPAYWYSHAAHFYISWITTAVSMALGFMVIYEVFLDVFEPFNTLRELGMGLFKWALPLMVLLAGVISVSARSSNLWTRGLMAGEGCVRIVQIGMVLFLLISVRYLGVSRRRQASALPWASAFLRKWKWLRSRCCWAII